MEQRGPDAVRDKIGTRPTGMPFNSVVALEMHGDRPMSPLVNAGAIATASFVEASSPKERFDLIRGNMSAFAGRELAVSEEIYSSESATNLRNRAIAYLLASAGTCYSEPMEALDVYTRACSVLITCTDLATMAATLANGGTNPATGKRCVGRDVVPPVLAEMVMEGMYDSSGDWAFRVGLPGKSGVGGGVMAVAPGKLGIAAFSPPLDEVGNSVRAQVAVAEVAKRLGLNLFAVPEESAPAGEQPAVTLQPDS
ncbi:beta-lactamase/transpeptidase-like protein [Hyaloraphidium curvatum]|nr:beta-lactamase/transpeptidase-like protein [Hyaloraphidium curvatum]